MFRIGDAGTGRSALSYPNRFRLHRGPRGYIETQSLGGRNCPCSSALNFHGDIYLTLLDQCRTIDLPGEMMSAFPVNFLSYTFPHRSCRTNVIPVLNAFM
jgi:hypothetical protein